MTVPERETASESSHFVWLLGVLLAVVALFSTGQTTAPWSLGAVPMLVGGLWLRGVVLGEAGDGARVGLAATGVAIAVAAAVESAVFASTPIIALRDATEYGVVLAFGAAVMATAFAAQVAGVVSALGARRIGRVTRVGAPLVFAVSALGALALFLLDPNAPPPGAALDVIMPVSRVRVIAGAEDDPPAMVGEGIFLYHLCRADECWVRLSRGDARPDASFARERIRLRDGTIAVGRVGELWLVAPGVTAGGAWADGVAVRENDRGVFQPVAMRPRDLEGPVGVPLPWRAQPVIAAVLALVALLAAHRSRRASRELRKAREGSADESGTIRLDDGALARSPDAFVGEGPVIVGAMTDARGAEYRRSAVQSARDVRPGTRAEWIERATERAVALEIGAITLLLASWAPLAAAWDAGLAIVC